VKEQSFITKFSVLIEELEDSGRTYVANEARKFIAREDIRSNLPRSIEGIADDMPLDDRYQIGITEDGETEVQDLLDPPLYAEDI